MGMEIMGKVTKINDISHHYAEAGDMKICEKCGKTIIGKYDFVQTRRGTKMYFHKGMKCVGGKRDG